MPKIFISYRRADSAMATGRLLDRLAVAFDPDDIFIDVDDISLGVDFREHIRERIALTDILLVIIGPQWLEASDAKGRRLDDPSDLVRIEVESGLHRPDCRVIPVLLGDTPMPPADQLPASLRDLAFRNAARLRNDPDFAADVDRLLKVLLRENGAPAPPGSDQEGADARSKHSRPATVRGPQPGPTAQPVLSRPHASPWKRPALIASTVALAALLLLAVVLLTLESRGDSEQSSNDMQVSELAPTLSAEGGTRVHILAFCERENVVPPRVTTNSDVFIEWTWTVAPEDHQRTMQAHLDHVRYDVRLDGKPLTNWEQYATEASDLGWGWIVHWLYPVGRLPAGDHLVDFSVTWDEPISDGWGEYGPWEVLTSRCPFTVVRD